MKTRLVSLAVMLLALSTSAFAVCLTEPNMFNGNVLYDADGTRQYASGFKDVWRNNLERDFADYGLLFEDAKDRNCSLWAKQALGWKLDDTLARATNRANSKKSSFTGIGPYQDWLEGAHVTLIMSAALLIGGHGDMTSALNTKIQSVITSFTSNPYMAYGQTGGCGIDRFWRQVPNQWTADTCMDEHTVGAAAYAWIAAYQNKRGNTASRNTNVTAAKTAINSSFSLIDSICLHDPAAPMVGTLNTGRGPCNVTNTANIIPVLTRPDNPSYPNPARGWTYSFNRGQNQVYGFGLLASISAALIGLEEADATDINGTAVIKDSNGNPVTPRPVYLTAEQKHIAIALTKEAQRSSASNGDSFNGHLNPSTTGFGNCRNFNNNGDTVTWTDGHGCADSNHRARFYSLGGAAEPATAPNYFLSLYVGYTPSTTVWDPQAGTSLTSRFTFNRFLWSDFNKSPLTENVHWARAVWYGNLGYYWHTIHPNRNHFNTEPAAGQIRGRLAATNDDHDPIGWVDGITSTGVIQGWTCDKDVSALSNAIDFYAGGVPGTGTYISRAVANSAHEPGVTTACNGGSAHRFYVQLPTWTKGQLIYPYGLDITWRGYTLLGSSCAGGLCTW